MSDGNDEVMLALKEIRRAIASLDNKLETIAGTTVKLIRRIDRLLRLEDTIEMLEFNQVKADLEKAEAKCQTRD